MTAETHATATGAAPATRSPTRRRAFRTDIQALRTVAVMAVVLNHLWPTWLRGGYIYFCDERKCYGVVGGVVVYFDANHLNREFSRTLRPIIAEVLERR